MLNFAVNLQHEHIEVRVKRDGDVVEGRTFVTGSRPDRMLAAGEWLLARGCPDTTVTSLMTGSLKRRAWVECDVDPQLSEWASSAD